MAGNKLYEGFTQLPGWAKGVISVVTLGVVIIIGKTIYNKLNKTAQEKKNAELEHNIDNEIEYLRSQGMEPTFNESQYNTFANVIYEGMRYAVGDDYGAVADTLKKMKNDLDVALLQKAFGFRQNYFFGIDSGEPMDLFTFVNQELGNEFLGITSYRVSSVNADWASKGIKYTI